VPGESISGSAAARALADNGLFHRAIEGFVPRLAQQEMAAEVERALDEGGTLVAESGTGTGKTYAYLVPVLQRGVRTIVSTGTRNLQDQVFHRDLPRVAAALGRKVSAVMLKGRSNYLCRQRLHQLISQEDFAGTAEHGLDIIVRWAASTGNGDIAEVSEVPERAAVWKQVTSTSDNCLGGKCPEHSRCFVLRARQKALRADLVVVNHHLFFSDLSLKEEGFGELLPACDAIIFDEAHGLAEVASEFFGFSVSSFQLQDLCNDIVRLEREVQTAVDFSDAVGALSLALGRMTALLEGGEETVLGSTILNDPGFSGELERLQQCIEQLRQALEMGAVADESMERFLDRVILAQARLEEWSSGRDRNLVRWLARGRNWFRLKATPLRIDGRFSAMMQHAESWVFTSATLAVGEDFSAFLEQFGIQGRQRRWGSPYDFRANTLMYLPAKMPDPRVPSYPERLAEVVLQVTSASKGRAFCLFTSHGMLRRVSGLLRGRLGWPVFEQGQAPRGELIDRFQQDGNAVLLGTASFWEGVDVRGEALSCVIIDKLPFASPSDPVLKSRLRACEESGGSPFMDIQVPAAIQSLKQGAGRLIRSETDRGLLVICDPRIRTSRYGKLFIQSLPDMPMTDRMEEVAGFFRGW
jgi:ATP-dependent DNA helicase DinG